MLAACSVNKLQETITTVDTANVVADLMMSRRSIRAYKDSTVSRETLNEILKCGINAPNGKNLQSYEIRVIDFPALIDSITKAVVKDNPKIAERDGFRNIFVNAPCVVCIAYDTQYDMAQVDCGLLGENIILAAWAKGIGSCCLGSSHAGFSIRLQQSLISTEWHSPRATNCFTALPSAIQMKRQRQNQDVRIR